ncbi:MAG: radical SAM protein [Myxococcota bacterium]
MTERCPARCDTCYLDAGPQGVDADPAALEADLDALAAAGVFEVALGGGEATARRELVALGRRIRARGMVPNLTTSGFGLDAETARAMAEVFGQVNVSVDGLGAGYRAVRGWDGTGVAERAIAHLVAAGARVGANTVLVRDSVDGLAALGRGLAARGVAEWQWLRLKPAGRARAAYAERALTAAQASSLWAGRWRWRPRRGSWCAGTVLMVPFWPSTGCRPSGCGSWGGGCPGGLVVAGAGGDGAGAPLVRA